MRIINCTISCKDIQSKEMKMSTLKAVVDAAVEILGFDPKSTKENIFKVEMTPYMAQYILTNHNKANRKFVKSQQNLIRKSIVNFGWLFDGDSCAFNTDGNLTEFQHRLQEIADGNVTRTVWIATGVKPDTFIQTAPPKNRTKWDAVYKYDNTATPDEVTTLEQLLKRRRGSGDQTQGAKTLTMTNASSMFKEWKDRVRIGMNITKDFFGDGKVKRFDPWQRQFNSWATLMVKTGQAPEAKAFLKLFKKHLTTKNTCLLFDELDEFFRSKSVAYLAGEKKAAQVHYILCKATDRFLIASEGDCDFDLDYADSNHEKMLVKSPTYYSFLVNPQGAPAPVILQVAP